ncbi:MAG: protein kinase [Pleurocapsa minor GSE-CHR-MK-17-07R]|jgi:serine/threonine-protein kinase|nr:protein kinase [Pleurocapsa minor GSE-CHR-MK 17-07R]
MSSEVLNGRYRLLQQIGSGGMAVIYKAHDMLLGRTVAVKVLRSSLTKDPAFAARFKNEARSVANLQHQHIVTVYDFGTANEIQFLVMEFIDGNDLKKIIKAEAPLALDRVLEFSIQLCAGIGFAHRAGIVHADIKPQNVLVTRDDTVKLTDFGIAQALHTAQSGERQAVVWGSPHYFSPEQARGERPTTASDVYSIGIVMYEMLTGSTPFTGKDQRELALAHLQAPVPNVVDLNPNVPIPLAQIIMKTMNKDPLQRYRMADLLGNVLKSLKDRGAAYTITPPPMAPAPSAPTMQNPAAQYAPSSRPPAWQQNPSVPVQPPTMPNPAPQQPQYMPRPADPVPTQRMDLAPHAPSPVPTPYGAPMQGGYGAPMAGPSRQMPPGMGPSGYTGSYPSQQMPPQARGGLDIPTVVLAVLAFMSVACLIPLYLAVFQARF